MYLLWTFSLVAGDRNSLAERTDAFVRALALSASLSLMASNCDIWDVFKAQDRDLVSVS